MIRRFLKNYAERHRSPANRFFHTVGLPVTFVLPIVLLNQSREVAAGLAFIAGYALQFIGHAFEGNDAGEVVLLKRALGLPYREFGSIRHSVKH
jgi:uncharacterized membrane protein YGL010W